MKERIANIDREIAGVRANTTSVLNAQAAYQRTNAMNTSWTWQDVKSMLEACKMQNIGLQNNITTENAIYTQSNANMHKYIEDTTQAYNSTRRVTQDVTADIKVISGRIQGLREQQNYYQKEVSRLNALLQTFKNKLNGCSKVRSAMETRLAQLKNDQSIIKSAIASNEKELASKQAYLTELRIAIKALYESYDERAKEFVVTKEAYQNCMNRSQFSRDNMLYWKERAESIKAQYDKCYVDRAAIIGDVERFKRMVDAVSLDIEELKKHCMRAESQILLEHISASKIRADNLYYNAKNRCEGNSGPAQELAELDQELQSLDAQIVARRNELQTPFTCGEIKNVCCKLVHNIEWNDYGIKDQYKAVTSSGRISFTKGDNGVKRGFNNGANRIRWISRSGKYTPMLTVQEVKTDGDNSYVQTTSKLGFVNDPRDKWVRILMFQTPFPDGGRKYDK